MEDKKLIALRDAPIPSLIRQFYWPAFVGVIANSLYNIVDRIFIGQGVGAAALSGVTVVFPVMVVLMAFGMLIGLGASVVLSLSLGRKEYQKAEAVLRHTVFLIVVVAAFITAVGFAIKGPLLQWFGATEQTLQYAHNYLNIILWGTVLQMFGFSMNNLIRAEGNAKIAMYSMLISAGVNIPMDALFILGLDMGVKGAAYATILSMTALSAWVLSHFLSKRSVVRLRFPGFSFSRQIVRAIIGAGLAPFFMQLASSAVHALLNHQLIRYGGDVAVGAMGVIMSVIVLVIMSIVALNMATQPIIGFNFGAKNLPRIRQTVKHGMVYATLIATGSWMVVQIFPDQIIRLFNDNPELTSIGSKGLSLYLLMLPVIGFQIVVSNYFRSVGKVTTATVLSLLRQVIVLIPMLFFLPRILGLTGIWLAAPLSDAVAAFLSAALMLRDWQNTLKGTLHPLKTLHRLWKHRFASH